MRRAAAGNLGQALNRAVDLAQYGLRTNADFLQHRRDDAFFILEQCSQKMQRLQLGIAVLGGQIVGALHRLLRLYSKFFPTDCHKFLLISFSSLAKRRSSICLSGMLQCFACSNGCK